MMFLTLNRSMLLLDGEEIREESTGVFCRIPFEFPGACAETYRQDVKAKKSHRPYFFTPFIKGT
jgi:hypothetical protein